MPIRLVTTAALLGGGYLIARQMTRRPSGRGRGTEPRQKSRDIACLEDIYLFPGPWSPAMVSQFQIASIDMTAAPNIDAEAQQMAFDTALALIPQVQGDMQDPARDQIVQAVLEVIAPTCDWTRDPGLPYAAGSRHMVVWDGVGRVHDLARAVLEAQGDI